MIEKSHQPKRDRRQRRRCLPRCSATIHSFILVLFINDSKEAFLFSLEKKTLGSHQKMIIKLNATRLSLWWRRTKSCFTKLGHFRSHIPTPVPLKFVDLTWHESWCVEARTRLSSSDVEGKLVQLTTCAQRWESSKKSNHVRSRLHLNTADHPEYFSLEFWFTLTIN